MVKWEKLQGQLGINSTTHQDTPQDIDSMQSIEQFEGEMFGIPTITTMSKLHNCGK